MAASVSAHVLGVLGGPACRMECKCVWLLRAEDIIEGVKVVHCCLRARRLHFTVIFIGLREV